MSELPFDGKDEGQLVSLSFTRKQFSDFVFTHIQTPSEEIRSISMGFEITKSRLKSVVDKIDYYIEKNNRLISKQFSSTILVDKNRSIKRGSYNDFFDIDAFESCFYMGLSVTISYLIDFGAEGGQPKPEKQVLVLRFDTVNPADVEMEIRSTEFTWPDAVFRLVQKELDDVAAELQDVHPISQSPLFFPARIFSKNKIDSIKYLQLFVNSLLILAVSATFASIVVSGKMNYISGSLEANTQNNAYVFELENRDFLEINPQTYLKADDWRERLSLVRDSGELRSYLGVGSGEGDRLDVSVMKVADQVLALPAWFYTLVVVLSVLIWLNFREAARIRESRVGRIWLSSRKPPARQGIAASEGVLSGLVIGITGSAIFAAIIAGVGSLVN